MRRLVAVAMLVALVAACEGGDGDDAPTEGGVLRVAGQGMSTLDPAQAVGPASATIADLAFDTVVEYSAENRRAEPLLATEWEVSENQRRFTFTLAEDATFHDGSPLTAADVKASWERVVAPATESPAAGLLEPVEGFAAARDGGGALSGVRAPDDTTLVVELARPQSDFVLNLTHPALGVLRDGRMRPRQEPVGSGPFAIDQVEPDRVVLRAADGHDALLDGIELIDRERSGQVTRALESNDADAALLPGTSAAPDQTTVTAGDYLAVGYYALNLRNPKLADERFRAAIILAIDPTAAVETGYRDAVRPAEGIVPSVAAGADQDACDERCGPDHGRAERLLREVFGDAPPPTIFLDHDDTPLQQRVAQDLARQLEEVGIPAELRAHAVGEYDDFLVNGEPDLFRFGWVGDVPAARDFLTPVFVPDAPENVIGVQAGGLVDGLARAAESPDAERRSAAYADAQAAVLDEWCVVPLAQFTTRFATTEGVRGMNVTPFGSFDGTAVWIEQ